MDHGDSPASSMQSTGDTGQLLQELMNLQKSNVMSSGTLIPGTTTQVQESTEVAGSGEGTNPTLAELMMTMYDAPNPVPRQLITLQGSDTANSFSVYGREVEIVISKPTSGVKVQSTTGSNKVKTTPVVKYDWEPVHYIGNLVAIHRGNIYAAYSLRGKSGGVVRIVNRKSAERALLKDLVGRVIDIAFAHTDDIMIAAVDEIGNIFVHQVKESDDNKLQLPLLVHVERARGTTPSEHHRVIWCPFIPDDCDDSSATESSMQDASRVLVLTHTEKAEIWNLDLVTKEHGTGHIMVDDVDFGLIKVDSHTQAIMDAAFSPDGTALATASLDGEVKFFQVNMNESTSPRCLHQWKPHDGKQLSCLFFLDDHKNSSADAQFWKFAVTGASNNQEIKIWSCESWTCLQTVNFICPPDLPTNFMAEPVMKAGLDLSARYLVLSDIKRQVLYVLQIHQDNSANAAHVSSVSEFLLAQPCLSFAILDASKKKFKKATEDSHLDEITTGEIDKEDNGEEGEQKTEASAASGVQIRLYTVHPKALQELLIRFRPESSAPPPPTPSISTVSQDDAGLRDALSDMSMSFDTSTADADIRGDTSIPPQDMSQPVLLTPDAFTSTSPRKHQDTSVDPVRASGSSTSSFTQVTGINEDLFSPRSSGDHSVISEGSTITQTPTEKIPSPKRFGQDLTPGSVPLPPITSTEEDELLTPKSKEKFGEEGETPKTTHEILNNVCIDDLFESTRQSMGQTIDSTHSSVPSVAQSVEGTTSTTGFDVAQIAGQKKHSSLKESYDEDDEEVAEVLGESFKDEETEDVPAGTQPFEDHTDMLTNTGTQSEGDDMPRKWPEPPHIETEDAIQQSEYTEEDDDVQVEEEEEVCEEEEEVKEDFERSADPLHEGSSEDIEEQIEEQSEESEQDSPKEAPVAAKVVQPKTPRELPEPAPAPIREIHHKEIVRETVDREALNQLTENICCIMSALEVQNAKLVELQDKLAEQQMQQIELQRQQIETEQLRQMAHQPQPNIEEHLGKLEGIVTSRVERMFTQHAQKENQRIHVLLQQSEAKEKQRQEQLHHTLVQTLNNAVASNMDRQIKSEMRNTVLPNVTRLLEPVKEQFHQEIAQKLTATDSLLKDNIAKMVKSRQTIESIGLAAGNAIQAPIQVAYREAFQNIVIPSFERATQNMFQQVNEAFVKGVRETTKHLDTNLDEIRKKHTESRDPVIAQLRKLTDSFQTSADSIRNQVISTVQSQIRTEMQESLQSLQDAVVQYVRQAVKEEVSMAVREQGASISDSVLSAMRSGAVTPVQVTPDPHQAQTHVLQLLRQGQLNAAFQQALSASNLDLVVFVCETVNPSQVFNQTPCPLQQPVLLSLIQQLSADIGSNTELKHKYLEEAVMNLDVSNHVTREHMRPVLFQLGQKLKTYIVNHPNDKTTRSLKMLQMASESLLK